LFLALSLAGPFLVLVTIVLATAIFIAFTAAVLVAPYLLIRGIHRYRERRPSRRPLVHPVAQRQRAVGTAICVLAAVSEGV
jgi:hypothetical protein